MDPRPSPDYPISLGVGVPEGTMPGTTLAIPAANYSRPDTETANNRVFKAKVGGLLDKIKLGTEDAQREFFEGRENDFRRQVSLEIESENSTARLQMIKEAAGKKGAALTPLEVANVLDPFTRKAPPVDPQSVIEKAYAKNYISSLNTATQYMGATSWSDAKREVPQDVADAERIGSDLEAKRQFLQTQLENTINTQKNQSWLGWGVDQAKNLSQLYQEFKLRGQTPGVGVFTGGGSGANIKAQGDKLFSMDFDSFKTTVTGIQKRLTKDNPSLAAEYFSKLLGQSTNDEFLNNVFTFAAPLDAYEGGKLGYKGVKSLLFRREVNTAVKTILKAGEDNITPTPTSIASASGDVGSAAVHQVSENIVKGFEGAAKAEDVIQQTMTSNFRMDIDALATNPGSNHREVVTRLQDNITTATRNIPAVIEEVQKIQRVPLATAAEDTVRALKDEIRTDYRGPHRSLLDVALDYYDRFTNTAWYNLKIGNYNGELFGSKAAAEAFAERNGFKEARILDKEGIVSSSSQESLLKQKDNLEKLRSETFAAIESQKKIAIDKTATNEARAIARAQIKGMNTDGILKYNAKIAKIDEKLATPSTEVGQQGVGFYLEVRRPLNETSPVLRDLMIKDTKGEFVKDAVSIASESGLNSWKNALFGKWRTPEDTLSAQENRQRKVAVYSQAVLQKLGDQLGNYIRDVANGTVRFDPITGEKLPFYQRIPQTFIGKFSGGKKQIYKEWEQAVDYSRTHRDEAGNIGAYFKTPGDLQDFYQRTFQRLPTYPEQLAYFAKVELDEYNRVLTNMAVYRNKARLGTEQHAISLSAKGAKTQSEYFDGVQRPYFPGGDGTIAVLDNSSGKTIMKVYRLGGLGINKDVREAWAAKVETGNLKVVEVWDPESRPLRGFAGLDNQRVQYILTDNLASKPLSYDQVPRRGGGHFDYDYNHYIKQANIQAELIGKTSKYRYEGDNTLMPVENRIMGKDISDKMNVIQKYLREGDTAGAQAYVTSSRIGIPWDELQAWFKPGRDPKGNAIPPRFDLEHEFKTVPKGKTIISMDNSLQLKYGSSFEDGTRHGSLARNFQVQYTQMRDADLVKTLINKGTAEAPTYAYEPARLVSALPTMNGALNRAIRSTFMDDYKIYGVEHWLREAEPYLNENQALVRSSPFYHFEHPVWRAGVDENIIRNLEANRYKIKQFVGIPSQFDSYVNGLSNYLAEAAYTGGKGVKNATIVPLWALSKVNDPVTMLRSLAFDAKLGLFSLPQILVQMQTYATIWALEPRHGGSGTYAALLHQWSRIAGDKHLDALDQLATKLNFFGSNFKPGQFAEARRELAKTGFEHVHGEYAALDDAYKYNWVKNDWSKFLDLGRTFFTEGERASRLGAWYTAFMKHRELNPTGALSMADRAKILADADLLSVNMSRASSSALHGGVLSLTTQFLSYQLRLAELFFSKRIGETVAERSLARMRLAGFYSALYGVPTAFGLSGLPIAENFRAAAIERGYVVGDNWLSSLFMEGIPSVITALVTGEGDIRKGKFYNIGDRYGAQGFTQIREALRSDGTWWKLLGGAGVSTFVGTIINSDGLTKALWSFMRGDTGDQRFTLTVDDVVQAGKEISSVNGAWRLVTALSSGKWLSKNEGYISDINPGDAIFRSITGLTAQEQDDVFTKTNLVKAQEESQKYALQRFIQEFHRSVASAEANDPDASHTHLRNAFALLEASNYPLEKKSQAIAIASKGWESRIDGVNFKFYLKDTPTDKTDIRRDTFIRQEKLNDYRKGL